MDQVATKIDLNLILANAPGNTLIWNRFLEELAQQLNSESSALLVTDLHNLEDTHFLFSANIPTEYKDQYENGLNKLDHFNHVISKDPKQIHFSQNVQQEDSESLPPPSNLAYKIGVSIPCNQNHALSLIINRKHAYNNQEQQQYSLLLQSIIPELEEAMHGEQRDKINSQILHYMGDHFDGYIIIDRHLNILFSDPIYTSIISQLDCVNIAENRLQMNNPQVAQKLAKLIQKNHEAGSVHSESHACRITLIPISSLQNLYKWECFKDGFILTFTHDKDKNPSLNRLTDIYHLSRCEALCALNFMKTPSISDVATNTYRSQETVRNHIKHTMQKMDVHNQAELMKKLITLSAL